MILLKLCQREDGRVGGAWGVWRRWLTAEGTLRVKIGLTISSGGEEAWLCSSSSVHAPSIGSSGILKEMVPKSAGLGTVMFDLKW